MKQDKFFITDTGLMSSFLGWRLDKVRLDSDLNGKLLETFVFTQLASLLEAQDTDHRLYHYRDREKRKIDFIIENAEGMLLGIEVKASATVTQAHFKHLNWFREHLKGQAPFIGIILYTGEHITPFGDNLWALPISTLWI